MDAVVGFFVWPFYTVYAYTKFLVALLVNLPSIIARIATRGPRSLRKVSDIYAFCSKLPLGNTLVTGLICAYAPYTASVGAIIEDMTADTAVVKVHDYPWLRNPFQSLHAVALCNVGELACGLVMVCLLEERVGKMKGIPVKIGMEYFKKARGTITAKGSANLDGVVDDCERDVVAQMYDAKGDLVCKCVVTWSIKVTKGQPQTVSGQSESGKNK